MLAPIRPSPTMPKRIASSLPISFREEGSAVAAQVPSLLFAFVNASSECEISGRNSGGGHVFL
jgi:hypothetical protein